jgi:hypothetical protein
MSTEFTQPVTLVPAFFLKQAVAETLFDYQSPAVDNTALNMFLVLMRWLPDYEQPLPKLQCEAR